MAWQRSHEHARRTEALPRLSWCEHKYLTAVPALHRPRDVVDLTYQRYHKSMLAECQKKGACFESLLDKHGLLPCSLLVDVSQDGRRKAYAQHIRSMCSNACYYSFTQDRLVSPVEHLKFLGWDVGRLSFRNLTANAIRDLAGEAMSAPSIGICITALALQIDAALPSSMAD